MAKWLCQYGWYARDRPRNVAIVMGSYENAHVVATAQYLSATDDPFVAVDVERRRRLAQTHIEF